MSYTSTPTYSDLTRPLVGHCSGSAAHEGSQAGAESQAQVDLAISFSWNCLTAASPSCCYVKGSLLGITQCFHLPEQGIDILFRHA